ncbi:hypothetical protein LRP50_25010 [Enterovibrio sp. ZSDZ42]|uniref:Sel1 repeat family protein n=1 Tax=Enterovibrio gelatinilyticus TaxID=2899819 RepID=A0ABT5R7Z6_9GAMM|nr:hypothetical protein [Enterovibrio sp. ZSDZ42]MDD1796381.1 hypothetical protein [Enterovibrio sp. ZSDZ42]
MDGEMREKYKHWILAFLSLTVLLIVFIVYPSGFQLKISKGPDFLSDELSAYIDDDKINSDPYAASRYRPEDPLYAPLLAIQYGNKERAETLLKPLVEKSDSEAMFWLAEITYGQSIYSGETAGKLFAKAAEYGNPYAAIRLDNRDIECIQYMSHYCSKEWGEKGREILIKLAESGDARAGFALYKHDAVLNGGYSPRATLSEESFQVLAKAAVDGVKTQYYYPLMELLDLYQKSFAYPIWSRINHGKDDNYTVSSKDDELIKSLYMVAARNNDAYSIYVNFPSKEKGNILSLDENYIDSQTLRTLRIFSTVHSYGPIFARKSTINNEELINGIAWALVDDFNRNNHEKNISLNMFMYFLDRGKNAITPNETDIEEAKKLSGKIIKSLTPMIYLDENQTKAL